MLSVVVVVARLAAMLLAVAAVMMMLVAAVVVAVAARMVVVVVMPSLLTGFFLSSLDPQVEPGAAAVLSVVVVSSARGGRRRRRIGGGGALGRHAARMEARRPLDPEDLARHDLVRHDLAPRRPLLDGDQPLRRREGAVEEVVARERGPRGRHESEVGHLLRLRHGRHSDILAPTDLNGRGCRRLRARPRRFGGRVALMARTRAEAVED